MPFSKQIEHLYHEYERPPWTSLPSLKGERSVLDCINSRVAEHFRTYPEDEGCLQSVIGVRIAYGQAGIGCRREINVQTEVSANDDCSDFESKILMPVHYAVVNWMRNVPIDLDAAVLFTFVAHSREAEDPLVMAWSTDVHPSSMPNEQFRLASRPVGY